MCGGIGVATAIVGFGVCTLVLLEKLEFVLGSGVWNRSLCRPSRICMSILSELVAVADCRRNRIVLWNSDRRRSSSTKLWRTGSLKAAERISRLPH